MIPLPLLLTRPPVQNSASPSLTWSSSCRHCSCSSLTWKGTSSPSKGLQLHGRGFFSVYSSCSHSSWIDKSWNLWPRSWQQSGKQVCEEGFYRSGLGQAHQRPLLSHSVIKSLPMINQAICPRFVITERHTRGWTVKCSFMS